MAINQISKAKGKKEITEKMKKKEEALINLQKKIEACRYCQDAFGFIPRPITFGNHKAKIMQISQAPSQTVHQTGKPFNDASGKNLRDKWYGISEAVFYNPQNFYIASMAHCYPGKAKGGGDRLPPGICSQLWLSQEIELVDNEIYIIIGGRAAKFFFPSNKITDLAFENRQILGKPAYILPHPSPLNIKWFKDNPEFLEKRILAIRKEVQQILKIDQE